MNSFLLAISANFPLKAILRGLVLTCGLFGAKDLAQAADPVLLSRLDLTQVQQSWGKAQADKSVEGAPLKIGGQVFQHGIGSHADSEYNLDLKGQGNVFSASVGLDDEVGAHKGHVQFLLFGDGKEIWKSQVLRSGDPAESVKVSLTGIKELTLIVDGGDSTDFDHADWADAEITMLGDASLQVLPPYRETAELLTPKAGPAPLIHSAKLFGVRPGSPFFYTIAATGDRPVTFSADGLPVGLELDPQTGIITGALVDAREYNVTLRATNSLGVATRPLKIICGPTFGLLPAMGWNSWNCFADSVSEEKIKSAADAMVASGLINHGWSYINIDDFWQVYRPTTHSNKHTKDPSLQGSMRDLDGKVLPNLRFMDMKGLASYIHNKGLKAGIYSSPGPWTCGGCVGSYQHEAQDAQSYADWGFDYLKYDWCSYGEIAYGTKKPNDPDMETYGKQAPNLESYQLPYRKMHEALSKQKRDILFSLCQYGWANVWEWGTQLGGNSWRVDGDINDTFGSFKQIGFSQQGREKYAGPGHFNDLDMLIVGQVGWGSLHPTHLSPNEQYAHISLWCLLTSPLLIGCDMTKLDDFTLNLLTNDEVLDVDQDPLCRQGVRVSQMDGLQVFSKDLEDGSKAVGLFNLGLKEQQVSANWTDLDLRGKQRVRDLWRQKDLGIFTGTFTATVPRHGVVLVRISPEN